MNEFDRDNADLWRMGIFYYNPKDSALMVPKRSGLGWTINFGHKAAFVILFLILAAIALDVLYSTGIVKF
jgi:uncharacterized membrane protein